MTGSGAILFLSSALASAVLPERDEAVKDAAVAGIALLFGVRLLVCFLRPHGIPSAPPKDQYDFPPVA